LVSGMRMEKKQNTQAENQRIVQIQMDTANFSKRFCNSIIQKRATYTKVQTQFTLYKTHAFKNCCHSLGSKLFNTLYYVLSCVSIGLCRTVVLRTST
jgi:hypothetical protein